MSFLIKMMNRLKNIRKYWIKSAVVSKGLYSQPVYNEKYLKDKQIKSYEGKINANFYDNGIPEEGSHCIFLSVILTYSAFEMGRNYFPQMFLEQCKYTVRE